ncbi:MAG: YabP/YqfC family sporulation protein [Clostridia bacterium]|nr:YabP/YqfC family sporulation protein [Clostridia bacterium]
MNSSKRNSKGTEGKLQETRPLTEWLAVKLDIPADALEGGIRLDMRGRNTLTVHGCRRILDFSPCEIRLSLKDCTLVIGGQRLICTSYLAGAVGVEGCICSISFEDGEVAR